jgi:tight adherence protein B
LRAARRRRREPRIATWLVLSLAAGIAIWAPPTLALAVAVLLAVADRRRRRWAAARRRRDESRALTAGLEVLVGELGVGAHPVRAFSVAAAESRGGVGDSLRAVATRAQLGADVSAGLRSAAANSAVPAYWDRLAICWIVAAEHGLSMSTLIRAAHRDIVDRQRFADRVQAGLAGARATATILAGLPIPSVAFFARPRQTSALRSYIRHEAIGVASKMSVARPARRYARGSLTPSWSEARIASCPPARS